MVDAIESREDMFITGLIDKVMRMDEEPPAEVWGGKTVWGIKHSSDFVDLQEQALIYCPACGCEAATWWKGHFNCYDCTAAGNVVSATNSEESDNG